MPREVGPSLNERQFFLEALKEEIRIDSRGFGDFRAIQLEFGEEYGVSDVRIGKTRYVLLPLIAIYFKGSITWASSIFINRLLHAYDKQLPFYLGCQSLEAEC